MGIAAKLSEMRMKDPVEGTARVVTIDYPHDCRARRQLRRMRPVYRSRRDALLAALAQHLPELEPGGIAAGLHLLAWLPQGLNEATVIAAAAREGVAVAGVSPYRLSPEPRGGLIFGYSNLPEQAIEDGLTRLARGISSVRDSMTTGTTQSTQSGHPLRQPQELRSSPERFKTRSRRRENLGG